MSAVVPIRAGLRGLRRDPAHLVSIRSVARQTLSDFECVVVDDASTDDSAEVVQRTLDGLADPRFSLIRLQKNVGQTGATRRGLAATRATFVCFLDSDDLWNPDFLERHLAAHLNDTGADEAHDDREPATQPHTAGRLVRDV